MAATTIQPVHWSMIVGALRDGECVPFLGAGVNAPTDGYPGLPLGAAVAKRLAAELLGTTADGLEELVEVKTKPPLDAYDDLAKIGLHDLARVALHLQIKGGYRHVVGLVERILADQECEPSPLLQALARLPLRLVVTTNYDRLLEKALAGSKPVVVVQPIDGFSAAEQQRWQKRLARTRHPILYKIHGTFVDAAAGRSRVIISEEDYIEFLTVATTEGSGVPPLISSKLVDSILLFLGYSLEDWDFRTIYKALIERLGPRDQRRSFAIKKDPSEAWEQYWDRKGVTIYNVDLYEFADELEQRYREAAGD